MKIQKLAIATVVAAVVLLLLDMVWYTMVMKDSMNMPNQRPEPDMMWMIISYVISTTLVTLNQALMDSVYSIVKFILLGIVIAYVAGGGHGDRQGGGKIPG